ncbi:MAG: hypothetical protein F4X02_12200 [Chloroflexi bacterium]|nr:hypothetical protein [Chloroflexota bacterium]
MTHYDAEAPPATRLRATSLAAMLPVLLLGFALGAAQLNVDILWVDEMATVSAIGAEAPPYSIKKIVTEISQRIPDHVPLYYVIGAGWASLVGWSQIALRYLSLLFGVLSVAFLYRFCLDAFDRRTAWLAALLFASNAMVIIYFHELRNYSLWLLLCIIHLWQYWRLADAEKAGAFAWISFTATTGALLYTHPFSPIFLLGLGVHHLLLVTKDRAWWRVVFAWGAGVASFLPYLPLVLAGVAKATESRSVQAEALTSLELLPILAHVLTNGVDLLWLALIPAFGWALWRKRSPALLRMLFIVGAITLSLLVFHALDPFVSSRRLRYFLIPLAFALVPVARLLLSLPRRRMVSAAFVILWAVGGYSVYQQAEHWKYAGHHSLLPAHPPLHRFADALQNKLRPYEVLVGFTQASFLNAGLYFGFSTVDYYSKTLLGVQGAFIHTELRGSDLRQEFSRRVGHYPYLTVVYQPHNRAANFEEVQVLLDEAFSPCEVVVDTPEIFAQRYAYHSLGCARQNQPIAYDNGIRITDRFAERDPAKQSIRVVTGWEVAEPRQLYEYNVSIQIISADWRSVVQAPDRHLYDDVLPWYVVNLSTAGLPAGDYKVMVILYDRETVKKAAGVDLVTGLSSDIHLVNSFTVDG